MTDSLHMARRAGRLPATLTPSQVSGLVLWLDASRRDSLSVDGSNRVSAWADLSGQGNTVSQGTEANMPTLAAAAFNGLDALAFDSSAQQSLRKSAWTAVVAQPLTMIWVAQCNALTGYLGGLTDTGGNSNLCDLRWAALGSEWTPRYQAEGGGGTFQELTGTVLADGEDGPVFVSTAVERSSSDRSLWTNGGDEQTGSNNNPLAGVDTFAVGVFARGTDSGWLDGNVCEVLVFDRALADAQRAALEAYLAAKWGATLA